MRRLNVLRLYVVVAALALAIALPALLGCACGSVPGRVVAAVSGTLPWAPMSCTGPPIVPSATP